MNENSQQKPTTIKDWVISATASLAGAGIGSAKLDAELIISHTLNMSRTYIHMYGDEEIDPRWLEIADARLQLRLERVPLAYIVGHKEFYGRSFLVSPSVLIPRSESEALINLLRKYFPDNLKKPKLVDVGTGSGCLGITAKLEFPQLDVTLLDIDRHALNIARRNAERLEADVSIAESDLLSDYPAPADIVIANLPYVDPSWQRSSETDHEPSVALFAKDGGLNLIKKLISQMQTHAKQGSLLLIEADTRQHNDIVQTATDSSFQHLESEGLALAFSL